MKRPWQIWLLFLLCLAMVVPAMVWLTQQAFELDRAEATASAQAEMEEAIGSALWQMDAELTRLLAPEIARPSWMFRSFYTTSNDTPPGESSHPFASPLLMQPSPYVRLHFEINADGRCTSPQCPPEVQLDLAVRNDATPENIDLSNGRLVELSHIAHYEELLDQLPEQALSVDQLAAAGWGNNRGLTAQDEQSKMVKNVLSYENVRQQVADVQQPPQQEMLQPNQMAQNAMMANSYNAIRSQRSQSLRSMDLQSRDAVFQAAAQQAVVDARLNYQFVLPREYDVEGISQTLWVRDQLILARRVQSNGETVIQGCWLDWPKIKQELLGRVSEVLPGCDLQPVLDMKDARFNRVLATAPAQLVVSDVVPPVNPYSPIRVSLFVAWGFLGLATFSLALLLWAVMALSERRAAFVSAVTHELRTPLTTFRMYAEMLSAGMVTDAEQRQTYLDTLQTEADRLSHLVENVLQYARLERNRIPRKRREPVALEAFVNRVAGRLTDRAAQADMQLVVTQEAAVSGKSIATDPAAVEQILFNLVDNACKYAAIADDRRIHLQVDIQSRKARIRVRDHGPGISNGERRRLFQPFSKSASQAADSAPGVGLGLALCQRLAADLGGRLSVDTDYVEGAGLTLELPA